MAAKQIEEDLEARLEGLDYLKEELIEQLSEERINFANPNNWCLLPKEEGGQNPNEDERIRSWKFAYSNQIVEYFQSIGAELSAKFARGLYNRLNKGVIKKIVYGLINYSNINPEIYNSLTDWEKLCFAAGAYNCGGNIAELKSHSLAQIVQAVIKRGIDYLERTHAVKRAQGLYETLLKIPGSQHYRKRAHHQPEIISKKETPIVENSSPLRLTKEMLNQPYNPTPEDKKRYVDAMLALDGSWGTIRMNYGETKMNELIEAERKRHSKKY